MTPIVTASSLPALRDVRSGLVARLAAVDQTMAALDGQGNAPPRPSCVDLAYPHRLGPTPAERRLARRRREAVLWLAAAAALLLGLGSGDGYVVGQWAEARMEAMR